LSEYDLKLIEDDETWRMMESLMLFEEICDMKWFRQTAIIIFFNKEDQFSEKIKIVDPKDTCFPEYSGGKNYNAALKYIQEEFTKRNKIKTRSVYPRVTCATDKNLMKKIFDTVKTHILDVNMKVSPHMSCSR
jgi:hypothetical protein